MFLKVSFLRCSNLLILYVTVVEICQHGYCVSKLMSSSADTEQHYPTVKCGCWTGVILLVALFGLHKLWTKILGFFLCYFFVCCSLRDAEQQLWFYSSCNLTIIIKQGQSCFHDTFSIDLVSANSL